MIVKTVFGFVFAFLTQFSTQALANTNAGSPDCISKPSYLCLNQFITKEVSNLNKNDLESELIRSQWQFEQSKNATFTSNKNIHQQLKNEEALLETLKSPQQSIQNNIQYKNSPPMLDAIGLQPGLLVLEALTLSLQDSAADNVKRTLFESSISQQNNDKLTQLIIETARTEIVAGAPKKGLNTLNTAHVDGFSDTLLIHEKQYATALGALSEKLFLDPTFNQARCHSSANPAQQAINHLFSGHTQEPLKSISFTPNLKTKTKLKLELLRTHKNAESCPLFITTLVQLFIQEEIELYNAKQTSLLSLIYFHRALRRYII